MATAQKITDQFLTCSICFEVFTDPVTLFCQHSFCSMCLVAFVKTKPNALRGKFIPCPFCHRQTKVSQTTASVETWVGELKASFLVNSMMDTFGPEASESQLCGICRKKGDEVSAVGWCIVCSESYCKSCLEMHSLMPVSREHPVDHLSGNKGAMVRRQQIVCRDHSEIVKIYCRDCDSAICNTCCSISHRTCEQIVPIGEMMSEMKNDLTKTQRRVEDDLSYETKQLEMIDSVVESLAESAESTKVEIQGVCKKLADIIQKEGDKMIKEVDKLSKTAKKQYEERAKSIKMSIGMWQQTTDFITQALKSDSESHIHDLYRSDKTGAFLPHPKEEEDTNSPVTNIGLIANVNRGNIVSDLQKMMRTFTICQGAADGVSLPRTSKEISILDLSDEEVSSSSDLIVWKDEESAVLLVTDGNNGRLKAFDPNQGTLLSSSRFHGAPWSLTQVKDEVIVTIPDKKQLVKCRVRPTLKVSSKIQMDKAYKGIAAYGSDRVIVSSDTSSISVIDIIDLQGRVMKSFTNDAIRGPQFLSAGPDGKIYFSDSVTKSIVALTPDGDVLFRVGGIRCPRGLMVTRAGEILFVDRDANKVTHLSATGSIIRDVLSGENGIRKPLAVSLEGSQLYITERGKGIKCFSY